MDFKYKKSGTIFNMHSYWTKQPIDPIMFFIKKYTKPGELILDPFCGTGMTGVAAMSLKRKVILNDISPISIHISKGYCTNFKIHKNIDTILEIKNQVLKGLEEKYTTLCTKCHNRGIIKFSIVGEIWKSKDGENEENRGEIMFRNKSGIKFHKDYVFKEFRLLKLCYKCSCSNQKMFKVPDNQDQKKWHDDSYKQYFYPKDDFFGQEPQRNYKRGIKKVYQLYSPRNLSTLSVIFNRIQKIQQNDLQQLFLFVFTSILFNSSLMSRYRDYENTSIKMGTFYLPPIIKDTNIISNFEGKLKVIMKGNAEIFKNLEISTASYLNESADELPSIKADSIDYIYTDPPYSDIINYSELNIVFESWLKSKTNYKQEMIVSKFHKKNIEDYSSQFENFLKRSLSVLKNKKCLTLVFHHPNIEHWKHVQRAIISSGFKPEITKKPIRLLSNSKTSSQHKTKKITRGFLVFNLVKDLNYKPKQLQIMDRKKYMNLVRTLKIEAKKLGYARKSDIYDFIINKLVFKVELQELEL